MFTRTVPVITPLHILSVGRYSGMNNLQPWWGSGGAVANATAIANRAYLFPLFLPVPTLCARFFVCNGTNSTGNVDVGVYDDNFGKIVSTGSTARSGGASTVQYIDVTDTTIPAGRVWLTIALDSANSLKALSYLSSTNSRMGGSLYANSAFALPSTITISGGFFDNTQNDFTWLFGYTQSGSV